jgi:hypothetical protein
MMSITAVQDFYQYAYSACRIGPGHFPSARAIQELVQAWKQVRNGVESVCSYDDYLLTTKLSHFARNNPIPIPTAKMNDAHMNEPSAKIDFRTEGVIGRTNDFERRRCG